MSGSAFTPGPWMAAPYSSVVGIGVVSQMGGVIATCPTLPNAPAETIRQQEANARLIAAAPSLYSDAEFLCARVRELEGELNDDSEAARQFFGHIIPALARMESALAEARGEAA